LLTSYDRSQGEVKKLGEYKYETYGRGEKINDTAIIITELPIHKWTSSFKAELEALCGEKGDGVVKVSLLNKKVNFANNNNGVQDYKDHSTVAHVSFTLTMSQKEVEKAMEQGILEYFKLSSKISTSNMMCFDAEGKIKKYNSPEEIIEEYYAIRLAYYQKRKAGFLRDVAFSETLILRL
jgi:DNA topoisomerase II